EEPKNSTAFRFARPETNRGRKTSDCAASATLRPDACLVISRLGLVGQCGRREISGISNQGSGGVEFLAAWATELGQRIPRFARHDKLEVGKSKVRSHRGRNLRKRSTSEGGPYKSTRTSAPFENHGAASGRRR